MSWGQILELMMQFWAAVQHLQNPGEDVTVPVPPIIVHTHGKTFEVELHVKRTA